MVYNDLTSKELLNFLDAAVMVFDNELQKTPMTNPIKRFILRQCLEDAAHEYSKHRNGLSLSSDFKYYNKFIKNIYTKFKM